MCNVCILKVPNFEALAVRYRSVQVDGTLKFLMSYACVIGLQSSLFREAFQKIEKPGHLLKIRCLVVAEAVLEAAQLGVRKQHRILLPDNLYDLLLSLNCFCYRSQILSQRCRSTQTLRSFVE